MVQAAEGGELTLDANPVGCLACHERVARTCGCCTPCYTRHKKAVAQGKTTWAALVAVGLVLPAQPLGAGWRRWEIRPGPDTPAGPS